MERGGGRREEGKGTLKHEAWGGATGSSQSGFTAQVPAMRLRRCSGLEAALLNCPEDSHHPDPLPSFLDIPLPLTWSMSLSSAASHPLVPALGAPLRQACLHNSLAATFPCLICLPALCPPRNTPGS